MELEQTKLFNALILLHPSPPLQPQPPSPHTLSHPSPY